MNTAEMWTVIGAISTLQLGIAGLLQVIFSAKLNASENRLSGKIEATAADIKQHVTATMLEHIRLEHRPAGRTGE